MSSKKSSKKRAKKTNQASNGNGAKLARFDGVENISRVWSGEDGSTLARDGAEASRPQPVYLNPETTEEREKRLAERKALTLRIFQSAYENHRQRRKAS
ncbi:MAG TPA: hypothetical protein VGO91_13205 [Pyrinomonadaceae bacterium]|nr:hypothetical protein [Pyrinomonadaceae bacterium]